MSTSEKQDARPSRPEWPGIVAGMVIIVVVGHFFMHATWLIVLAGVVFGTLLGALGVRVLGRRIF